MNFNHFLFILFTFHPSPKGVKAIDEDLYWKRSSKQSSKALNGPIFVKTPNPNIRFINTVGASVDCLVHGYPEPEVRWRNSEGREILPVPNLRTIHSNGTLHFHPFTVNNYHNEIHSNIYICSAKNLHGSIVSYPIYVTAVVKQNIEAKVYDEYVINGNTAVLTCHLPAFYKDYLTVNAWIRNDNFVIKASHPPPSSKYAITVGGKLYIDNTEYGDDVGMSYRCQVEHLLSHEMFLSITSAKIHVTTPHGAVIPRIVDHIDKVRIKREKMSGTKKSRILILPCAAQGNPPPVYSWYILNDNRTETLVVDQQRRGHLKLDTSNFHKRVMFVCKASNSVGEDIQNTTLIVYEPLKVHISPQLQLADVGSKIHFNCSVTGYPVHKYVWKRNGVTLKAQIKSRLMIEEVKSEDWGMYQCFVRNDETVAQATSQLKIGNSPPSWTKTFKERVIQRGQTVEMSCEASGSPLPVIRWYLDGEEIEESRRKQIHASIVKSSTSGPEVKRSVLRIRSMKRDDGGLYTCAASNSIGNKSHTNYFRVYGLPKVRSLQNVSAPSGEDVIIKCYVTGYPIESIKWKKGGGRNSYMPLSSKDFKNGTIVLQGIENGKHDGEYVCIAKNKQGHRSSSSMWLKIVEKPSIGPLTAPSEVKVGMHVTLVCTLVQGDVPVTMTWYRNGLPLMSDKSIDVTEATTYSLLHIRMINAERHRGNYTCKAQNSAGSSSKSVRLNVAVPPKWMKSPNDAIKAILGERVVVHCQASGYPTPSSSWIRVVHDSYKNLENNSRMSINKNGTLEIMKVRKTDSGRYRCEVTNNVSPDLIKEMVLEIGIPPNITSNETKMEVEFEKEFKVRCQVAEHGDDIRIIWYKNGRKVQNAIRIWKTENSTISILTDTLSSQSSKYSCEFKNRFGSSMVDFSVSKVKGIRISSTVVPSAKLTILETFGTRGSLTATEESEQSIIATFHKITTVATEKPSSRVADGEQETVIISGENHQDLDLIDQNVQKNQKNFVISQNFMNLTIREGTGGNARRSNLTHLLKLALPVFGTLVFFTSILFTLSVFWFSRYRRKSKTTGNNLRQSTDLRNRIDDNPTGHRQSLENNHDTMESESRYGKLNCSSSTKKDCYEVPNYYANQRMYGTLNRQNGVASRADSVFKESQTTM